MSNLSAINTLTVENKQLKIELAAAKAKQQALLIERDFWVEQGRNLQNSLQTSQRMYADLFDQLGRGVVTDQSISDNLAMASEHLQQPLTSVEAIRGLTASMDKATQGEYSLRNADKRSAERRLNRKDY